MISLKDYIKISIIENKHNHSWNNIEDFYDHFFIEYELHGCKKFINENYGKYDGQIDLIKALIDELYDNIETKELLNFSITRKDIINANIKNPFYNSLEIQFGPNIGTSYIPLKNNFNENVQCFNKLLIKLDTNRGNITRKRLFKNLMHELTHAWHDYCSHINDEYGNLKGKSLTTLGKESKYYHDIRKDKPIKNSEKLCKSLLYLTTKFESNAYLSEIYSELETYDGEIISWKEAWEVFRNSSTYKDIMNLYLGIKNIDLHDNEYKNIFVKYYNEHNKTNLTLNKIQKIFLNKLEKLFDKICKTCAKIYCEWSEKQKVENDIKENIMTYYSLSFDEE